MNKKTRDLIAGAIILLMGLTVVFLLIPMGVVEPRKIKFAALSPSYYPRIVAFVLMITGTLILALAIRMKPGVEPHESDNAHPHAWIRCLVVLIVLAAFAALLEPLGFVLTSALTILILLLLGGERRVLPLAGVSILAPVILYYFFVKVPRIPIPNGILSGVMPGA